MERAILSKEEAVNLAQAERGDVPPEQLVAFINQRFGVQIDPRFIPILKATLLDKQHLAESRARARALALAAIQPPESTSPAA